MHAKMHIHIRCFNIKDNDEIDRLLFQALHPRFEMMEQWRIKRYNITMMASHRQFTTKQNEENNNTSNNKIYIYKERERLKGKKIAETLCVLFLLMGFYAQRSRCFSFMYCLLSFEWHFWLCIVQVFKSISLFLRRVWFPLPIKMNCQPMNVKSIDYHEDSITRCRCCYNITEIFVPVISVNYEWNANRWKSNLSVCIKNYINHIRITTDIATWIEECEMDFFV